MVVGNLDSGRHKVYVDILREYARKGDMFSLDEVALWYKMHVIGAVTL